MNDLIVKNVDVFGDSVLAAKDENGIIWVGIRWMCEGLGMTEGQMKRQITNIKADTTLSASGSNLILNKSNGERTVFCLKLDYVPLWLAKISITPKMKKETPELAEKLLDGTDRVVAGFDAIRYTDCHTDSYQGDYMSGDTVKAGLIGEYAKIL